MKSLGSLLVVLFLSFSLNAQEFKFQEEVIDYGKIDKGSDGAKVFIFKNIGDQPIIIKKIQSSCGCTVPKKPEKPIMPGEDGEIKVSYDTKRVGGFSKSITIMSNAKNPRKIIRIKGIVNKEISLLKEKSIVIDN
ncbi:MAG: DUF1573 domain-containing protein [Polaribacter sp.]|jgi:hypothetical protein|nr:DUF1573 domain-containing protein [Polaribacter sp.]MBT7135129.1 DUF1573 domain-containing protein [Polaribacter sp.]